MWPSIVQLGAVKRGRNEDLLTEQPTLAVSRLCHGAWAVLLRKQQVRSSNLRVGSNSVSRSDQPLQAANLGASDCRNAEDLLTVRFPERHTRGRDGRLGSPKRLSAARQPASPAVVETAGHLGSNGRMPGLGPPAAADLRLQVSLQDIGGRPEVPSARHQHERGHEGAEDRDLGPTGAPGPSPAVSSRERRAPAEYRSDEPPRCASSRSRRGDDTVHGPLANTQPDRLQ
jgi:hypothetical protein